MELELDTAKLNFEVHGDPKNHPLVLWHGAGCTLRMWDNVLEGLKEDFFTISFDIRGSGKSINLDEDQSSYSFEVYANDLNQILKYLNIEKFHIWSMAWGTRAAIAYSSLYSSQVLTAVFSDASIGAADVDAQKSGLREALKAQDEAGIPRHDLPKGWNEHINNENAKLCLKAAAKFDLGRAIKAIDFPFLVMTGDYDPNLSSSKEIVRITKTGKLEILEGIGHGSVLQRPDLTLDKFLKWHELREKYA